MLPLQVRAQPIGIPSLGAASSSELSPALERTLGAAIMEQGRHDPSYINDPDVDQYLTSMGHKLVAEA
ncbi:MAG: peptidase, partial [Paralcaligenes sp.]